MNVPKLRFKEFDGEWEEKKLDSFVTFYSGLTYSPDDIVKEKGTLVLRSSNVQFGSIVNADNVYVNPSVVNSEDVLEGDIIVVVRNGSRNLIGKHAQVKRAMPNTVIGAFMTGIRSKVPNFLNVLLDTKQFQKEINKNLGATINQITTGSFKKMSFLVSENIKEQEKIGNFFEILDKKIQLQQQKIDLLQEQKKGYMQKIFNRELRFRDASQNQYTDWKLETVKDVFEFYNGKAHEKNIVLNGEYIVVNSKFISTEGSVKKYSNNQIFPLVKDDIAMVMSDVPNGKALAKCHIIKENNKFSLNQRICCLRTPMNSNFFYYQLNRNNFYLKFDDGVSQTNLRKEDVLKCPLYVPCLEEQNKIANFLMMLDKRIELEKEKLFNLKHRKDGFMQQMFI